MLVAGFMAVSVTPGRSRRQRSVSPAAGIPDAGAIGLLTATGAVRGPIVRSGAGHHQPLRFDQMSMAIDIASMIASRTASCP